MLETSHSSGILPIICLTPYSDLYLFPSWTSGSISGPGSPLWLVWQHLSPDLPPAASFVQASWVVDLLQMSGASSSQWSLPKRNERGVFNFLASKSQAGKWQGGFSRLDLREAFNSVDILAIVIVMALSMDWTSAREGHTFCIDLDIPTRWNKTQTS